MGIPKQENTIKPSRLSPAEQTRLSWATRIASYQEIPVDYQWFFDLHKFSQIKFPFTVITPSFEGFLHRYQEKMVCLFREKLYIVDKTSKSSLLFKLQDISLMEFRKVLLDSSFILAGVEFSGKSARVDLHFNTVTEGLFWEIMRRIRQSFFHERDATEKPNFDELRQESFKFASYSRNCLIPGEKVKDLVWQPELKANRLPNLLPKLIKEWFERIVFPNHLLMITDQELILIRDDEHENRKEKYGAIWQVIPLSKIRSVDQTDQENGLLKLILHLSDGTQIDTLFLPQMKERIEKAIPLII